MFPKAQQQRGREELLIVSQKNLKFSKTSLNKNVDEPIKMVLYTRMQLLYFGMNYISVYIIAFLQSEISRQRMPLSHYNAGHLSKWSVYT